MVLSIITIVKSILEWISYGVVIAFVIFLVISLIATQIMDIYEARTGESWEARCRRIKEE